jgi:hypothetical protein
MDEHAQGHQDANEIGGNRRTRLRWQVLGEKPPGNVNANKKNEKAEGAVQRILQFEKRRSETHKHDLILELLGAVCAGERAIDAVILPLMV